MKIRLATTLTVLLMGFLALSYNAELRARKLVVPPQDKNLSQFLADHPEIKDIKKFRVGDQTYFEVVGVTPVVFLSLPSGPPAYIFDEYGKLVDWTPDLGDTPSFDVKWRSAVGGQEISQDEARRIVGGRRPAN